MKKDKVNAINTAKEITKMTAEKWARQYKIDTALVAWWTNTGKLLTEEEFLKIKKQVYKEE